MNAETKIEQKATITAATRKAVAEWVALGCSVKIAPDGTIEVKPPERDVHEADFVDWSRK